MGIYINLNISDTITEEEWAGAYQKSVQLMEKMPFIEKKVKEYHGEKLICAVKTVEREWEGELGWHTIGDSITLRTAEDYFLPREILSARREKEDRKSYADPYMSVLPSYSNFDSMDERCNRVISLWGWKTQAEPYHSYLLAVACMLEQELPGKVAIYGDITRGQCRRAIEIASELLGETVELPDRCDLQRLYDRLRRMPLWKHETVDAFTVLYLGNQDEEFGAFLQERFAKEELKTFWHGRFGCYKVGSLGFLGWLKKYLLWGFPVAGLKEYVRLEDEEGNDLSEKFVRAVLDTEIFLEDKDCEDVLEINQEADKRYGVLTLLAQFMFAGAKNQRVNRYIPMEELEAELKECVGEHCDVADIVAKYLEERCEKAADDNPTDILNGLVRDRCEEVKLGKEKYDIFYADDLMLFQRGNTIAAPLDRLLLGCFKFYRKALEENDFKALIRKGSEEAIRFLIQQNRYFLLMEESWERIFYDIESNIETLERYYPMVRVEPTTNDHISIVQALVLNDELYQYCMERFPDSGSSGRNGADLSKQ